MQKESLTGQDSKSWTIEELTAQRRNQPAGQCWLMLLPSVPAGRPAASVTTPAGQALPAAAVPAVLHSCRTSFTSVMYDAKPRLSRAVV
ncbi:hypothetical protein INR49_008709 [Caranx melampygus]|nr:hypothetical protein INR49_008709 [Caranx melampygus]